MNRRNFIKTASGILVPAAVQAQSYLPHRRKAFAFTPSNIAGLTLWLRADDITGSTGDAVATWSAAVGSSATQATSGNRPTLRVAERNGHNTVRFDGSNDYLTGTVLSPTANLTVFVVSVGTDTGNRVMFQDGSGNGWGLGNVGGLRSFFRRAVADYTAGSATTSWEVRAHAVTSSTTLNGWINGSQVQTSVAISAGSSPTGTYSVGCLDVGAGNFWYGDIAEVLVYDSALSVANKQAVEDYLGLRYSITITH